MSKDIIQTILLESLKISSQSDAPREGSRPCKRLVFLATKLTSVRSLHLLLNSGGRENKFWYVEKIGSSLDVSQGFLKQILLTGTYFSHPLVNLEDGIVRRGGWVDFLVYEKKQGGGANSQLTTYITRREDKLFKNNKRGLFTLVSSESPF